MSESKIPVQEVIKRRLAGVVSERMSHSYAIIDNKGECYWCKKTFYSFPDQETPRYALVNIWGTVYDVPCCKKCLEENNGKCRDEL